MHLAMDETIHHALFYDNQVSEQRLLVELTRMIYRYLTGNDERLLVDRH